MTAARNSGHGVRGVSIRPREAFPQYIAQTVRDAWNATLMSLSQRPAAPATEDGLDTGATDEANTGGNSPGEKTRVCRTCGNTIAGRLPDECPVCGASREEFDEAP